MQRQMVNVGTNTSFSVCSIGTIIERMERRFRILLWRKVVWDTKTGMAPVTNRARYQSFKLMNLLGFIWTSKK